MTFDIRKFEKLVSRYLIGSPALKSILKRVYFRIFRFFGRVFFRAMKSPIHIETIGAEGVESFKGYYDVSPENDNGLIFVYESSKSTVEKPASLEQITIAIYRGSDLTHSVCTISTKAFNWQQGSRAYWLDGERLIFNDYCPDKEIYIAKIWNVVGDVIEKEIDFAVESKLDKNKYLSINFKRLAALRPDYGYFAHSLSLPLRSNHGDDGIWIVDIESGKGELIYSLDDIISTSSSSFSEETEHKLNHLMVSPDNKHCLVVHRYFANGIRRGRLMLVLLDERKIIEIPTGGIVSHYCWLSADVAVGYVNDASGILRYYHIDIASASLNGISKLNELNDLSDGDGHPTNVGGMRFVADTYPNRWGIQKLIYCGRNGETQTLASMSHGIKYGGESRCDLHPAFCAKSGYLYFDSVFSGKRRLYRRKLIF